MTKRTLSILALVILAAAGCDQDRTGALSANGTTGASASAGTPHPVPATPAQPLPGWQIHINSYAKFAVWHPPGWAVSEHRGQDRSLELRLIPPGGQGGVLIRRLIRPGRLGASRDRGGKFTALFDEAFRAEGIRIVLTPP
jgi:hypothetical protein